MARAKAARDCIASDRGAAIAAWVAKRNKTKLEGCKMQSRRQLQRGSV